MKVAFFALRDFDELAFAERFSKQYGIDFVWTSEYPNKDNLKLAEGCDGVSFTPCEITEEYVKIFHRRLSCDKDAILTVSKKLYSMKITVGDFERASIEASKGDFIFFDSPYAPLNATSFEAYTKEGFDIDSHKRLARLYDKLTTRGVYCMLTNHNTEFINELYGNKGYRIDVVAAKRMINSDASNRMGKEVIICNY